MSSKNEFPFEDKRIFIAFAIGAEDEKWKDDFAKNKGRNLLDYR